MSEQIEIWDLWFPEAAAQGLPFARGRLQATSVLLVMRRPRTCAWMLWMMTASCWRVAIISGARPKRRSHS